MGEKSVEGYFFKKLKCFLIYDDFFLVEFFKFFSLNITSLRLNFRTSQLSEAQEKANIKTPQAVGFPTVEVTLPKQKLKIFRREIS